MQQETVSKKATVSEKGKVHEVDRCWYALWTESLCMQEIHGKGSEREVAQIVKDHWYLFVRIDGCIEVDDAPIEFLLYDWVSYIWKNLLTVTRRKPMDNRGLQ